MAITPPPPPQLKGLPRIQIGSWQPKAAQSAILVMLLAIGVLELGLIRRFAIIWDLAWGIPLPPPQLTGPAPTEGQSDIAQNRPPPVRGPR